MTRGCWNCLPEVGATNPSEELESPGKAQAIIRLLPLDPTHALPGPIAHVTDTVVLLSRTGSKLCAGKDAARVGQMTGGRMKGLGED